MKSSGEKFKKLGEVKLQVKFNIVAIVRKLYSTTRARIEENKKGREQKRKIYKKRNKERRG